MANASQTTSDLKGDWLSVKMLGVVPDGVTDNYARLNAAITAAGSQGSPVLYFPVGTYRVVVPSGGGILVPSGLQLVGDFGSSITWTDAPGGAAGDRSLFRLQGANLGLNNLTINGQLNNNNNNDFIRIGPGIMTTVNVVGTAVTRVSGDLFSTSWVAVPITINGIPLTFTATSTTTGLLAAPVSFTNGAFVYNVPSSNIRIVGCHFNGNRDNGFQTTNCIQIIGNVEGLEISDSIIEQCWYAMYRVNSNTSTAQRAIRVAGNLFSRNFGDDCNFNCPGTPYSEFDISVVGNSFEDNQSDNTIGGFGVSSAFCVSIAITGNTFNNYQREPVHLEFSRNQTIADNTFLNCATVDFGVIHVIAASDHVAITGNTIDSSASTSTAFGIDVQPGGALPCSQVVIANNVLRMSATTPGIYVGSTDDLICHGNMITGPGAVIHGAYTGGTNTGIDIGGVERAVVCNNVVEGFGYGIGSSSTVSQVGDTSIIGNNTIYNCNVGLAIKANGNCVVGFNLMTNCVSPTATGSTTIVAETLSFVGNRAVGCANRMDVYDQSGPFNWLMALNMDDVAGATIGATSVLQGFGSVNRFPASLVIGAGAPTGPAAASIAWGQNSGFQLQFGTVIANAFSPTMYIDDEGNIVFVGTNPSGGVVAFKTGKFTTNVLAGASAPVGSEALTVGFAGAVIEGSLALPNLITPLPLFDTGPGRTLVGGLIDLTSMVTGVLPVGNGGTGVSALPTGFLTGGPALGSLAFGASGSFLAFSSEIFTNVVNSVNFTAQTVTTISVVESISTLSHSYSSGLVTT